MDVLSGKILVASPQLRDPNFAQTVVLLIQHESQGTFGLVLNRPGDKTVDEVWRMLEKDPCNCQEMVFVGGPVPGPLMALHTVESLADEQILPGLYVTAQADAFEKLFRQDQAEFRLYSGNSGWGAGQLEGELELGGWLTTSATVEDVFSDHETLWQQVTSRIGLKILAPNLRPEQIPKDPGLN